MVLTTKHYFLSPRP